LSPKLENKLGRILNSTLELGLKETLKNLKEHEKEIISVPLIVIKLEKPEHSTELSVLFHQKYTKPYSIFINDYIILLYEKESHLRSVKQSFFGVTDLIGGTDLVNFNENSFNLGFIKIQDYMKAQEKLVDIQSESDFQDLRKLYRETFKVMFGEYPKEVYFQKFCKAYTDNSEKYSKTLTRESFKAAMKKSLE